MAAPNPLIGLVFHWTGGLAAASFYIPYKKVQGWAWETYWLVGGCFSWIIAPILMASLLVPDLWDVLRSAPGKSIGWSYFWGLMWGIGGLTFGLSMRYLGIALGYAVALGLCTAFGTLMPPLFEGKFSDLVRELSGQITLIGIAVCLVGIALSGLAGVSKERELTAEQKVGTIQEFNFLKGLLVATFAGVMSASFAYGLAAGKPIAAIAADRLSDAGGSDMWQHLPVLVVVLLGGFTTNLVWCVILNTRNGTGHQYTAARTRGPAGSGVTAGRPAPLLANYALCAAAGFIWYLQFFFYSMGSTRMGRYEFSSWTLHMASIIIFSTLWGVALKEWKGTSRRTHILIGLGLAVLIGSTVIIGYGNYVKSAALPEIQEVELSQ